VIRGVILVLARGYFGGMQIFSGILERVLLNSKRKWDALNTCDCILHSFGIISKQKHGNYTNLQTLLDT
jgi:hypothetical protein